MSDTTAKSLKLSLIILDKEKTSPDELKKRNAERQEKFRKNHKK